MVIRFTQLSLDEWPSGVSQEAALLALSPTEIERRTGISFESSYDDLDAFDGALIMLPDGEPVALQRHRHAPVAGTTVILHDGAVDTLVKALALLTDGESDVTWIAPDLIVQLRPRTRKRLPMARPATKPFRRRGTGIHLRKGLGTARRRLAARHHRVRS